MVGGHHDHRLVVQPGGAHPVQQLAHQRVGVLDLQHVALEALVDEPLVARPAAVREAGVGLAVARRSRRPSGRKRAGPCGSDECMKMSGGRPDGRSRTAATRAKSSAASSARRRSMTLPRSFAREPRAAMPGNEGSEPKPTQPRSIAGSPSRRSSGSSRCCPTMARSSASALSRARSGGRGSGHRRAGHTSVIGSTTDSSWLRRKSVKRLRGWWVEVGSSPTSGSSSRDLGRDRLRGGVGHGRRVAIPGRAGREPRQIREQRAVDPAVRAGQGRRRQLVEDDVDDRRRGPPRALDRRRRLAGQQQVGDRRDEEEEGQEHEWRGGEER